MNRAGRIYKNLQQQLSPTFLQIVDESHKHAGHSGNLGGLETHFSVEISAKIFHNKSKIEQHKIINTVLRDEFVQGLHALSIKIRQEV